MFQRFTVAILILFAACSFSAITPTKVLQWIRPSFSVFTVYTQSEISSRGDMSYYFAPSSKLIPEENFTLGFAVDARIYRWFSLSLGAEVLEKGHSTARTKVSLLSDPFDHDFESRSVIKYTSYPILLKAAYDVAGLSLAAKGGIIYSKLWEPFLEWKIDGQPSDYAPTPEIAEKEIALTYGGELGYRFRSHSVFTGFSRFYGQKDLTDNFKGRSRINGWQLKSGYRFYL